jgi:hypothetical protein
VEIEHAHDTQVLAEVDGLVERAVALSFEDDRSHAALELATAAETRTRLEELRDVFVDRLLQRSDDFEHRALSW